MLTSPHLLEPLDAIYLAGSGKNLPIEPKMWRMLEDEVQKACCIGAGYASEFPAINAFIRAASKNSQTILTGHDWPIWPPCFGGFSLAHDFSRSPGRN